jgi:molybdate transport system substrate-binding protein
MRMSNYRFALVYLVLTAFVCGCQLNRVDKPAAADSEEPRLLRVVTSGGFATAYERLTALFEKRTGIKLVTAYGSSSGGALDSIPVRLERGERFDIVIMSQSSLNQLTELGEVRSDSRKDLAHSLIGMTVSEGAAAPDISTPDLFIEALVNAQSIGFSASASGTYLSTDLFPRLGLWEQLQPKSKRIKSERVATVVARGDVQIGFQQISEILPIEGARYVGPIPSEYQKVTTFSTGITTRAENIVDARLLIDYLSSTEVASVIADTGLEPVVLQP